MSYLAKAAGPQAGMTRSTTSADFVQHWQQMCGTMRTPQRLERMSLRHAETKVATSVGYYVHRDDPLG
jgi:hypothetical protein